MIFKKIRFYIFIISLLPLAGCKESIPPEDVPRAILGLGRLHPLLLHLPIGAILLTFFLDITGRIRKNYPKTTITYALGFSSVFAGITAIFGYFLSLEGGFNETILDRHFWAGIISAVLVPILYFLSKRTDRLSKRIFFPSFVLTIVSITVTGHFGSVLTHGDDYLTQYLRPPKTYDTIEHVDSLRIYSNVVQNIFDSKCTQCHNNTKKKGEFSILSINDIIAGGSSGKVIEFGNPANSLLINRIHLPISDEDHMPPEGKPQLTNEEIKLIEYWIKNGNGNDSKIVSLDGKDSISMYLDDYLIFDKVEINEASIENIIKLENVGFSVKRLVPDQPELWVRYLGKTIDKKTVNKLKALEDQIVELDLGSTNLSDKMTSALKSFRNIKKLGLDNTQISDRTLRYLEDLEHLENLNIVNTSITYSGVQKLLNSNSLKKIYLWNTKMDEKEIAALSDKYSEVINAGVFEGFVEDTRLRVPELNTDQSIITDSIILTLDSKLRGTSFFFTLDGSEPDNNSMKYAEPIRIDSTTRFAVIAYKEGWLQSETLKRDFLKVKHKVEKYSLVHKPGSQYSGPKKLFDLELGSTNFKDDKWNGYLGDNLNATVDFETPKTVKKVMVNTLGSIRDWIMWPTDIEVYASEMNNSGFKLLASKKIIEEYKYDSSEIQKYIIDIPETTAQYFKIVVKNPGVLPKGHEGEGNPSWIFVDEIMFL